MQAAGQMPYGKGAEGKGQVPLVMDPAAIEFADKGKGKNKGKDKKDDQKKKEKKDEKKGEQMDVGALVDSSESNETLEKAGMSQRTSGGSTSRSRATMRIRR